MSEVKSKKVKKGIKKHNKSNVVPFKLTRELQVVSRTANPVDFEQLEKDKVNQYGRDLAKEVEEYLKQLRMSPGFFYYFILFHIKQAAVFSCSYPEYKMADNTTTKEIGKNYSEMLVEEFPELGLEKKKDTDTVH